MLHKTWPKAASQSNAFHGIGEIQVLYYGVGMIKLK